MSNYTPDNWVILEMENTNIMAHKVVGGWSGGYLDGNSWRMNSGIVSITEDEDHYYFNGYSGSVYVCHKNTEELRMNIAPLVSGFLKEYPDHVKVVQAVDVLKLYKED